MKAVPRRLWNDGDHSSAERERLRPVLAHDFQGRSAVENVNQLVAGEMGFPMTFPRELGGEKGAVAVGKPIVRRFLFDSPSSIAGSVHGTLSASRVLC